MGNGDQAVGVPRPPARPVRRRDGAPPAQLQAAIRELSQAANRHDGAVPLSDAALLSPAADSIHLLVPAASGELDGYAFVDPESGMAELVVRPAARGRGLGAALMAGAIAAGGRLFWAHGDLPAARELAREQGARAVRTLLLLGRAGEGSEAQQPRADLPPGFRLRPYGGAADDDGLLRVNAAAFTDLPDQGDWSLQDLRARTGADWFDSEGLLVLERIGPDGASAGIVGFHWTKVHPDGTGEVYVLALDPAVQGGGLAGPLTRAGLAQLRRRACPEVILFVDSGNERALALYERLGFTLQRRDVLYAAG